MNEKLIISKKDRLRGEDGYKTFSVRVQDEIVKTLDHIADQTGRSRNEIINLFLEFGIHHYEIKEHSLSLENTL